MLDDTWFFCQLSPSAAVHCVHAIICRQNVAKSRIILLKEVNTEVLLTIKLETDVPCLDVTRVSWVHVSPATPASPGFRATPSSIMNWQALLDHERSSLFEIRRLDWIRQFSPIRIQPPEKPIMLLDI